MDARLVLALPVPVRYSNEPFSSIVDQLFQAVTLGLNDECSPMPQEEVEGIRIRYPENSFLKLFAQS